MVSIRRSARARCLGDAEHVLARLEIGVLGISRDGVEMLQRIHVASQRDYDRPETLVYAVSDSQAAPAERQES